MSVPRRPSGMGELDPGVRWCRNPVSSSTDCNNFSPARGQAEPEPEPQCHWEGTKKGFLVEASWMNRCLREMVISHHWKGVLLLGFHFQESEWQLSAQSMFHGPLVLMDPVTKGFHDEISLGNLNIIFSPPLPHVKALKFLQWK